MRTVWAVFSMARPIDWRIHQVAYVENLKPLRQSNFSTAWIKPEVAFLDQVGQRQARPLVLAGYRNNQTEVGVDELGCGVFASEDGLAKLLLTLGREVRAALQLLTSSLGGLDDLARGASRLPW